MKIKSITKTNEVIPTYDIEVDKDHHYILENGCVSHNSSVVSNSTNGIEPPRQLLSIKKSKQGVLKQLVPDVDRLGQYYTLAWELQSNKAINEISAIIQKWIDQAISINHYYNPQHPLKEETEISLSEVAKDLIYGYQLGNRNFYYANTNDGKTDAEESGCVGGGCSV